MELLPVQQQTAGSPVVTKRSRDSFLQANTSAINLDSLITDCIIPVFAKDNESTISHPQFIEAVNEATGQFFSGEQMLQPAVRVSHPIKGRIPEAMGKPAKLLTDDEKTIYYERMMFLIELPGIRDEIQGQELSLVVGGVRSYNHENLYARKTAERFKVFIGFQVKVCTNLCVWTDGYRKEIKVRTLHELAGEVFKLLTEYQAMDQIRFLKSLTEAALSESQFARLIGRLRMYPYLPSKFKEGIPELQLTDSMITPVVKGYYQDEDFGLGSSHDLPLWQLYNLFTGAAQASYIDRFLDRSVSISDFVSGLITALNRPSESWYLS